MKYNPDIKIWVSDWGLYEIPGFILSKSKLRKDGYFDKRSPNVELKRWIELMDADMKRRAEQMESASKCA